mgnify:CR=1 FL=1
MVTFSRQSLTPGDVDRNWSTFWSRDGLNGSVVTLYSPVTGVVKTNEPPVGIENRINYEWYYRAAFSIPRNTLPGKYEVRLNDARVGDVNVTQRVKRADPVNGRPINTDSFEAVVANWKRVTLDPGNYTLNRTVAIPSGADIDGYGARIVIRHDEEPWNGTQYHHRAFVLQGNGPFRFEGITFDLSGYFTWLDAGGANCVFKNCTFINGGLGKLDESDLLVQGCKFLKSSAGRVTGGTWFDCDFIGTGQDYCYLAQLGNRLCILDCRWDNTERGLGLASSWGPFRDCYFGRLSFNSIAGFTENSAEITGCEGTGPTLDRCLFLGLRTRGCEGPIMFWQGDVTNCLLKDFSLDRTSIYFMATNNSNQSDNVLEDMELRGGQVWWGKTALRNKAIRVACINPQPSRSNQWNAAAWKYKPVAAFAADRPDGYDVNEPNANQVIDCTGTTSKVKGAAQ